MLNWIKYVRITRSRIEIHITYSFHRFIPVSLFIHLGGGKYFIFSNSQIQMKLTPLFIVRESVSVEVCCCFSTKFCAPASAAAASARSSKSFQKFAYYLMRSHTHTHTLFASLPACLCVSENKKIRHVLDIHIRHSMLRFVSCCCLFYHLTIFSECLHPKNNFCWATFPGWLAGVLAKLLHTFSCTDTHTRTKKLWHAQMWALPSNTKKKKNKQKLALSSHSLSRSLSLSLLDQRTDNYRWRRHISLLFECNSSSSNNSQLLIRPLLTQGAKAMVITQIPITHVSR